ncbi:zinc ABC transporter permease [Bifidobacterium callitrichos]|nr:zinc ABC transporter permease [Bifidobacterium callitrichos]
MTAQNAERKPEQGERKKRTGLGALATAGADEDFSVIDAIGGPRGVIESMLPGVLFVVMFVATNDLNLTIGVSAALAVVQVIVRLVQRQSVMGALSGLIAVGICLIWAWKSHEARNYYMFGFLTNAGYAALLAVSLAARVPGLGLVIEFIRQLPTERLREWFHDWMDDKALKRAYMVITALWMGLFLLRLAVQVPLYLTDHVAALGVARLIMGIPFWALAIWVSYLIIATPLHRHKAVAKANAKANAEADN